MQKFEWMNWEYVRRIPHEEFKAGFCGALRGAGLLGDGVPDAYVEAVIGLMRERTKAYADAPAGSGFFFTEEFPFDDQAWRKHLGKPDAAELLQALRARFAGLEPFTAAAAESALRGLVEERGISASRAVHPLRVAVSGLSVGPGLFEMLDVIGRDRVLGRIDRALGRLG
jgi:glutamyl-tRNA synthetase